MIQKLGFSLDEEQPQINGERYLMSGKKLVLMGRRASDQARVVIKVSSDSDGVREIEREHTARIVLHKLHFAMRTFYSPEELVYIKRNGYIISITRYIEQDKPFLARSLDEQFFLALQAFEAQEGVHATTYAHAATIRDTFGMVAAQHYIDSFAAFQKSVKANDPENIELGEHMEAVKTFLDNNRIIIERYSGFLTHEDFSLHNLRIVGHKLYLLDHTSIYFGNKYESWARFINFMMQFNPALEKMLTTYVRTNRREEEYVCLRLMRLYKVGELLQYHTAAWVKSEGNIAAISRLRISFWTKALAAVLEDSTIPDEEVRVFLEQTNVLRSDEEKQRNRELLLR